MISNKFSRYGTSIFTEMSLLAKDYNAINLSQGFPNFEGPKELKEIFANEIMNGWNQYITSPGDPELRESLAEYYKKNYKLSYNPDTEITISHGATEALFNTIVGIFNTDDEIIVFEPFYDAYIADISAAGAKTVSVRLKDHTYDIDFPALEKVISKKTRGLIINSPHNPSGKIFTDEQLNELAKFCKKHGLIVLSDEVYEHIYFDEYKHISIANYPDMKERTIVISSLGKSFSFTGWKVGWVLAPQDLTKGVRACHQFTTFSTNQAGQKAAKYALNLDDNYFDELRTMYKNKRDILYHGLTDIGFKIFKPNGTYFFLADYSKLSNLDDVEFARFMTKDVGVAIIPPSSFYLSKRKLPISRFCFAKTDDVLYAALDKLKKHFIS